MLLTSSGSCRMGSQGDFVLIKMCHAVRLYGWKENNREVEMDMREMVDKVKKGEPLYGHSDLTPYMQGVAARNSRYSALLGHVVPWANFVNHNQVRFSVGSCKQLLFVMQTLISRTQHGVDTAKYYQQAERELEAERLANAKS